MSRYLPAGSAARGPFAVEVTPDSAGWDFSGLRVVELPAGGRLQLSTEDCEYAVLPLSGSAEVTVDGVDYELAGRESVFTGVSDFLYVPREQELALTSRAGGRFALPFARCGRRLPVRYGPAAEVPVEIRGAGVATRQVNNFLAPEAFAADKLCAVEVLTPGGNWSSYPPHKHDQERPGEAVLEEIYFFQTPGLAYQRVYDQSTDLTEAVSSDDVVLIPHGYHGPSMAAPGYDLYYLNVLAGPAEQRSMAFCDDPAHGWIRDSWADVPVDPRVPFFAGTGR